MSSWMSRVLPSLVVSFVVTLAVACGGGGTTVTDESVSEPEPAPAIEGSPTPQEAVVDETVCRVATGGAEELAGQLNRDVTELEVPGGLRVILKQTPGNPVVSVRLLLAGGSTYLTSENAGIEQLSLDVATSGGTTTLDKAQLSARLNAMGSNIGADTDFDYTTIGMSTLRVFLDETWALYRDVLRNPAFPDEEVVLARQRQVQSIRMRDEDPDARVADKARELLFAGHPYANRPLGTVESVEALSRDDLVAHYPTLFERPNRLLVVVGDVTPSDLEALIADTFDGLLGEGAAAPPNPPLEADGIDVAIVEAALPTNYIMGLAPAPSPMHDDFPALRLATNHLADRLFEEIRTERNLSYAVSAGLNSRLANYTYLYITTVDPAAALPVMADEVERLQTTLLTEQDVENLVAGFITDYYQGIDSNASLAITLGWWELLGGGREEADRYLARLRAVTPEDIQRVSRAYLRNYQFAVVGNPGQVTPELFAVFADSDS